MISADRGPTVADEPRHRLALVDVGQTRQCPAGAQPAEVVEVVEQAPHRGVRPPVAFDDGDVAEAFDELVDAQRLLHLDQGPGHARQRPARGPGDLGHVGGHLQLAPAGPADGGVGLDPAVDHGLGQPGPPAVAQRGAHLRQRRLQGHRRRAVPGHAGRMSAPSPRRR